MQNMAGEWVVRVNDIGKYYTITTYNTSANVSTEMWLQASGLRDSLSHTNIPGVKGKVGVEITAQAFSANGATNVASNSATVPTFTVANGKVITNGTTGPVSKTPADSIYFELTVSGATYKVSGFHRTGFMTDEPASLNP